MRRIGKLFWVGLLACCLPVAAAAQAAPSDGAAAQAAPSQGAEAAVPPVTKTKIEGYPGRIHQVTRDGIVVLRAGQGTDPRAAPVAVFLGKLGVPVSGEGKNSWLELRRGDLVLVSYQKGPAALRAVKVQVLPKPIDPRVAALTQPDPTKPVKRTFVGFVKKKEGDELIVMTPKGAPPSRKPAEVKAFIRKDDSRVEVLRESWDEIRKGDRVQITFQKGNPRPIDVLQVIRRGGEEPLPPGVATRLFDARYDENVKDVDGIGETKPLPRPVFRPPPSAQRFKRPKRDE